MRQHFFSNVETLVINNDLDKHIQAKTNEQIRRFGDILAPLPWETN